MGIHRDIEHQGTGETGTEDLCSRTRGRQAACDLFAQWHKGDAEPAEELVTQVHRELRQLAQAYLRRERRDHTLQPTELVNEAFARLLPGVSSTADRAHFFSLAARAMRRILVDHARRLEASKRFDPAQRVTLDTKITPRRDAVVDVLSLHQVLDRFAEISPRSAKVVELRYFGGLTNDECAVVLGASDATIERDWKAARVWLRRELTA